MEQMGIEPGGEDNFEEGPVNSRIRHTSPILMCTHDGGENAI